MRSLNLGDDDEDDWFLKLRAGTLGETTEKLWDLAMGPGKREGGGLITDFVFLMGAAGARGAMGR